MNGMKKQCGLTLIEIMIAVAFSAVLMAAVYSVVAAGQETRDMEARHISMQYQGVSAMDRIKELMHQTAGTQITTPADGENPYDAEVGNPNATEVVFRLPEDLDGDGYPTDDVGNIEWGNIQTLVLVPGMPQEGNLLLLRTINPDDLTLISEERIARGVATCSFEALSPSRIRIFLSLQREDPKHEKSLTHQVRADVNHRTTE